MACQIMEHRDNIRLGDLPDNQGGEYRHKCCGCAYDWGYKDGSGASGRMTIDWDKVEESQAGLSRHKNANDAYKLGYADGKQAKRLTP